MLNEGGPAGLGSKAKTLNEMVTDFGYPFEVHMYTTEDGYINTMHRICGPKGTTKGGSE
jgi:hypothetical protein